MEVTALAEYGIPAFDTLAMNIKLDPKGHSFAS
jgi:hypothetical protein